jgi:hydroxypyruvate reductase
MNHLDSGIKGEIPDTPKPEDDLFKKVSNIVIGNNRLALKAAETKANSFGFNTIILSSMIEGEAREIAYFFAAIIKEIQDAGLPLKKPACILAGGEPTVKIKGSGKGGRNQELALALAATGIQAPHVFISCGSDGTDGPTDAAGAIVSQETGKKAISLKLDMHAFLNNNDSYNFFKKTDDLIITGPTRTNVMDIMIAIIPEQK